MVLTASDHPEATAGAVEVIRRSRPRRLVVAEEEPGRRPLDEDRRRETLALIDGIDWDCELTVLSAPAGRGVVAGLNEVFKSADRAVVLEDGCLPDPTFFTFCEELLARYATDLRVMAIAGQNLQFGLNANDNSYYFSRYPLLGGWATWRRAWELHDPDMSSWPERRAARWLEDRFEDPTAVNYWSYTLQSAYDGTRAWDYAFLFACWLHEGLTAVPNANLITDLGFRLEGTDIKGEHRYLYCELPTEAMTGPLLHPGRVEPFVAADAFTEEIVFSGNMRHVLSRVRELHAAR